MKRMVGFRLLFSIVCILIFSDTPFTIAQQTALPSDSNDFLELVQEKAFLYFKDQVNPYNGLTRDNAPNSAGGVSSAPASIAATGFALSAYPVGVKRGWMGRVTAQVLTQRTLEFFLRHAPEHKGFFYHFLNFETGERISRSELSPIDTAIFLAGAIFAAEYYDDPEIRKLVLEIYNRVDFPWMLNKGKTFALSWSPESGFSRQRWDHFDESLLLYAIAIGSPTHPVPPEAWKEVLKRVGAYRDYRLIQMPPLFTHQYPHIWLNLRDKNDGFADYFKNSTNATLANRVFCIDQASKFSGYGLDLWGLSASDGPLGYSAYGAPPGWSVFYDGTIAPTACGSSIVFTPQESVACLRKIYEKYGDKMWGRYGFSAAMNVGKNWFSGKVFAIDQGSLLLMIENYRSGLIWKTMAHSSPIKEGLQKMGFTEGTVELPWPEPPEYRVPFIPNGIQTDGFLKDWPQTDVIKLSPDKNRETGSFNGPADLSARVRFSWDEKYLYFVAQVNDDEVIEKRSGKNIWRDDLLELYIDPEGNGFSWGSSSDFQYGFRPAKEERDITAWSWFQGGEDLIGSGKVQVQSYVDAQGYILEGAIRWEALGILPQPGMVIRLTPAVHDIDSNDADGKLDWFSREQNLRQFALGKLILDKAIGDGK